MAKQKHDLGVRKRRFGRTPLSRSRLRWERLKRNHPGPLPRLGRDFRGWVEAGQPRTFVQ